MCIIANSSLRKLVPVLMVIIICLALSSCSQPSSNSSDIEDERASDIENTPIRVTGDLHDSTILEYGVKTAHGYYDIIQWPSNMMPEDHGYIWYGNLVYIDYATCQRIILCNRMCT